METSVQKRLRFQNEVMKWLTELSGNLLTRANDVTHEIDELLGQTDTVEQDMKNTLNSFRNLTCIGFVDNKITEEDDNTDHSNERTRRTGDTSIRAQSYEEDILPRYREALSVGLSSYRGHMQKTNRTSPSGSVFKSGLASNCLPHIIGSAEYIHDNSCGLTDDFSSESSSLDFSHLLGPKQATFSAIKFGSESSDAIFSDVFGAPQGQTEKDRSDPLVSAALDFKAMLEAALLSPYKFYDEGSSSLSDPVHSFDTNTEQRHSRLENLLSTSSDAVEDRNSQNPSGTMDTDTTLPVTPRNLYSETQWIGSELIYESLFSAEEESMLVTSHDTHDDLSTKNMSSRVDNEISADSKKDDTIRNSKTEDEYVDAIEDDNVPRAAIVQEISTTSLSSPEDVVNVE
ncbi:WASH complex subunit 2-like [Papaver somniferum]|uniref:WASH complex subunit 2-like n=1 Tax=Papaver somniferum TaxID=3469 RepID=UPI000E7013EB|nr:WASH complex subunit 2-like [Papaver somniferum]